MANKQIVIHSLEDFEGMRKTGKLAADTLKYIGPFVKPGISTSKLNDLCHEFIVSRGGIPAPLNYKGFPKSVCTSINYVVCHGIPGEHILKEGDIINIDVTTIVDGWYGDTSKTFLVGKVSPKARKLVEVTEKALMKAIGMVAPGVFLGDIGNAIEAYARSFGYSVVKDFCGHGIGREFHGEPNVLHYGKPKTGPQLVPGMFFTIEPMINIGKEEVRVLSDGWTAITKDLSLSAQFEHTVGVTDSGYEIFTIS